MIKHNSTAPAGWPNTSDGSAPALLAEASEVESVLVGRRTQLGDAHPNAQGAVLERRE
jgi:hypothetical protein